MKEDLPSRLWDQLLVASSGKMQRLENRGTTSGSHRQALLGEKWLTTSASQEPGLPLGISAGRAAALYPHPPSPTSAVLRAQGSGFPSRGPTAPAR